MQRIRHLLPEPARNHAETKGDGSPAIIGDNNKIGIPPEVHADDMRNARNDRLQKQISEAKNRYPRGAAIIERNDSPSVFKSRVKDARIVCDWENITLKPIEGGQADFGISHLKYIEGNVPHGEIRNVGAIISWKSGAVTRMPVSFAPNFDMFIEVIDTDSACILIGFK